MLKERDKIYSILVYNLLYSFQVLILGGVHILIQHQSLWFAKKR